MVNGMAASADRTVSSSEAPKSAGIGADPSAQRIAEAAEALFCARGYDSVSIRDIAEQAGVKKASVFYHFGTKEKLFEGVLDRYYEAHAEALQNGRMCGGSVAERMHALLDAYMDFMEDHSRYVRLVHIEVAASGPALPLIEKGLRKLSQLVEEILGDHVPCDGPLAAKHFFVSFSGIVNTYALYASAMGPMWKGDPLSTASRRERRAHVHWVADALLEQLARRR
jgi:AcrR family transcriptional regulator